MLDPQHPECTPCGASHGSVASLVAGFGLSILLTLIPYLLVVNGGLPRSTIFLGLVASALLQLWVQMSFFLHLNARSEARWNVLAFAFTTVVVVILVAGTLWIMYNLNYNMMDSVQ